MTQNAFLNALAASFYITLVASMMYYGPRILGTVEDTVITPIAMLSLFVLSAAVMGYLFLSYPLQLYLDGQKKQAVNLFIQTIAVFAGITALIFLLLVSDIFPRFR